MTNAERLASAITAAEQAQQDAQRREKKATEAARNRGALVHPSRCDFGRNWLAWLDPNPIEPARVIQLVGGGLTLEDARRLRDWLTEMLSDAEEDAA